MTVAMPGKTAFFMISTVVSRFETESLVQSSPVFGWKRWKGRI